MVHNKDQQILFFVVFCGILWITRVKTGNAGAQWGYMTFYGEKKGDIFRYPPCE